MNFPPKRTRLIAPLTRRPSRLAIALALSGVLLAAWPTAAPRVFCSAAQR